MKIIFEDDRLLVCHTPGESSYAVATFNGRNYRGGRTTFWGKVLADKYSVECFGFSTKGPNWFPRESMLRAAEAVSRCGTKPLITYGHSMGGYASVRYSQELSAIGGVASGPLISIRPDEAFNDTRYSADYDASLHQEMLVRPEHIQGRILLVYDPYFDLDRKHADEIVNLGRNVESLPIPYLHHKTVLALKPNSVLLPLFDAILHDESIEGVRRIVRQNAKSINIRNIYLARALLISRKPSLALKVLRAKSDRSESFRIPGGLET